jgi:protein tyrosine/serine phosphatase
MTRKPYVRTLGSLVAVLFLSLTAFAKDEQRSAFPQVKIKNFGQMDARFYRGAQPKRDDYAALKALGIKTVIDLRDDATDYERPSVEALGMKYVNIPMSDKDYPREAEIEQFLKLVDDPSTGAFYVHCAGGRHRTGVMGAVYRFTHYGWDYTRVYAEMKEYDFYTRFGHGDFKKFVENYWTRIQSGEIQVAPAATTAAAASSTQIQPHK